MEPTEYPAMSGSNTICVATVLLERGLVELKEPETTLRLEAPAGLVEITRAVQGPPGREHRTGQRSVLRRPAGRAARSARLGTIRIDVAFGGMWYAIADSAELGFTLRPSEARDLAEAGERIREAAREQLDPVHPENPEIAGVSIVQIAEPWRGIDQITKNAVVVAPGRLDRSATGTGLSARMAVLHARSHMSVGDKMAHASVIGSTFDGRIVAETEVGGRPAIIPAIRGSAFITGVTELVVDPADPFPEGYLLSDTWPGDDRQ